MSAEALNGVARKEISRERKISDSKNKNKPFAGFFIKGGFDFFYLCLVFVLLTVGLVMMFSASYVSAKYSSKSNYDPFFYIKKQLVFAIVGIIAMFIVSRINPLAFKKFTVLIAVICIIFLVLVLIFPTIIDQKEDFKRWLTIPIIKITFQPSDLAKLGMIMLLAWMLEKYKKPLETKWWVALIFFAVVAVFCYLIYKEKHLSCTMLMFAIGICMLFLGGVDKRWFIIGGIVFVALVAFVFVFRNKILDPYQVDRIDSFLHKDYSDVDSRWQTNQSLFALGSGGFFGLGFGNSRQKHLYMPEPQNDFIFAIVGEELGFLCCLVIIVVFASLVCRGFVIALRAKSTYDRMIVLGISLQVGLQTILNILVVTDMMPNTGIALPFFSSGGTSLLVLLVEMGMVLAVSRKSSRVR